MCQISHFQIDQYKTSGQPVVEDQINEKMPSIQSDALLAGHKSETFPQFQEELTQLVDQLLPNVQEDLETSSPVSMLNSFHEQGWYPNYYFYRI